MVFDQGRLYQLNTETLRESANKTIQRSLKMSELSGASHRGRLLAHSPPGNCFIALLRSGVFEIYKRSETGEFQI